MVVDEPGAAPPGFGTGPVLGAKTVLRGGFTVEACYGLELLVADRGETIDAPVASSFPHATFTLTVLVGSSEGVRLTGHARVTSSNAKSTATPTTRIPDSPVQIVEVRAGSLLRVNRSNVPWIRVFHVAWYATDGQTLPDSRRTRAAT